VATHSRETDFVALGHAGSEHYAGLETFPSPGVSHVRMVSGELCIESKSLKLYLSGFRNEGRFCEALAVRIRDDVAEAVRLPPDRVRVTLVQKARGGITITAIA
jgi:NADPH-dependent 7-cyano-7-deazaguanine reductase QueF